MEQASAAFVSEALWRIVVGGPQAVDSKSMGSVQNVAHAHKEDICAAVAALVD